MKTVFDILNCISLFACLILFSSSSYQSENIFPVQEKHVHSSSIVELPNGDLLTCWFEGSGERKANDVLVLGSRKKRGNHLGVNLS